MDTIVIATQYVYQLMNLQSSLGKSHFEREWGIAPLSMH